MSKKKNDTPIEMLIPLGIFGVKILEGDVSNAITYLIVSFIVVFTISIFIRYCISKRYKTKLLNSGIQIIDKMSGEEFEKFLLVHFEKLGYKVKLTPKTGDYGADLILNKDGIKTVVQAKRWNKKVGIEAIQQIIGARSYYKADRSIVITNNFFTKNAVSLAKSSEVILWDRDYIINKLNIPTQEILNKINMNDIVKRDICPKCGGNMVHKKGKYGEFLGCSNYPKCRYTQNIGEGICSKN